MVKNKKSQEIIKYYFEVPEDGYVYFEVQLGTYTNNGKLSTSTSWHLPVTMKNNHVICENERVDHEDPWVSHAFSMEQGDIVELAFTSTSKNTYVYSFDVRVVVEKKASDTELIESEWNDLHLYANTSDTYTFTMPEDGDFYFELQPDYFTVSGKKSTNKLWWIPYDVKADNVRLESGNAYYNKGKYTSPKYFLEKGAVVELTFATTGSARKVSYYGLRVNVDPKENIEKSDQTISAKNITKTYKYCNLKKKSTSFNIEAGAETDLTYKKVSGNSRITVSKDGKVVVKKGTPRGTYKVKIAIKAKETEDFNSASKNIILTVKVK